MSTYNLVDRSFQFVCSRDVFYQISLALLSAKHKNQLAEFFYSREPRLAISSIAMSKFIEIVFEVFVKSSDISSDTPLSFFK